MTPEQEEAVRRALAAETAGPPPPPVVARLDATLADLVAERTRSAERTGAAERTRAAGAAGVGDRARRARGQRLLVAASSVAVLTVGGGVLLQSLGGGGMGGMDATESADSTAGEAPAAEEEAAPSPKADDSGSEPETLVRPERLYQSLRSLPVRLRSESLDADVARVARAARTPVGDKTESGSAQQQLEARRLLARCARPSLGSSDLLVPGRLDGRPVTLVLRAPEGGTGEAEVLSCEDADRVLGRVVLPSR